MLTTTTCHGLSVRLSKMDDEVSTNDTDTNGDGGGIGNVGGTDMYNYDHTKFVTQTKTRYKIHRIYAGIEKQTGYGKAWWWRANKTWARHPSIEVRAKTTQNYVV